MLVSHVPGRLRVRERALRGEASERLAGAIRGLPGVREACACPLTGSVLVCYEPGATDLGGLLAALGPAAGEGAPAPRSWTSARSLTKAGLAGTFGLCLGAALVGARRVHVLSGVAFSALALLHVLQNRRRPRR